MEGLDSIYKALEMNNEGKYKQTRMHNDDQLESVSGRIRECGHARDGQATVQLATLWLYSKPGGLFARGSKLFRDQATERSKQNILNLECSSTTCVHVISYSSS